MSEFLEILRKELTDIKLGMELNLRKEIKWKNWYIKEEFNTYLEVRRREKQIKGWTRLKKEQLILYRHPLSSHRP